MNKTFEAIGQALFKKWFVEERKEEWKIGKLEEFGKIQPGFAFKSSDFINEGHKLIKIRNIQDPIVDITKVEDFLSEEIFNKIDKKFYLGSGDILIAMTGAELGKVGIIPKTKDKMLLNQRVGKVISENPFLFYFYLTSSEIQGYFEGIASASSAQGNISNTDIERVEIIVPNKETIEKFKFLTRGFFELWISNLQQNQTLSAIRDALLPKLMSGEIRIK
jgi:type I restriction enzyme S subunit